jgi:hypothetical protein
MRDTHGSRVFAHRQDRQERLRENRQGVAIIDVRAVLFLKISPDISNYYDMHTAV